MKLYQNALKLHSQGPLYFAEAEEAYAALFRSEIFTYFESLSEAQRIKLYGEVENEVVDFEDPLLTETAVPIPATGADGTPSTLPQILYLSYKNRGQFHLDQLKCSYQDGETARLDSLEDQSLHRDPSQVLDSSLKLFVEALERDDTDVELWRQVSKIGESLGSRRIARYCLEAVLDQDINTGNAWSEPLGLQETFAAERLKSLVQGIDDDASKTQVPTLSKKQRGIVQTFKKYLDPLPYLSSFPTDSQSYGLHRVLQDIAIPKQEILVPLRTWASCGKAILSQLQRESQGLINPGPGAGYILVLPAALPKRETPISGINDNPEPILSSSFKVGGSIENSASFANSPTPTQQDIAVEQSDKASQNDKKSPMHGPCSENSENFEALEAPGNTIIHTNQNSENDETDQQAAPTESPQDIDGRKMSLPTRKRPCDDLEADEPGDTGRTKSKRIKARASIGEPSSHKDAATRQLEQYQEDQLLVYSQIDQRIFDHARQIFSALRVDPLIDWKIIQGIVTERQENTTHANEELLMGKRNISSTDLINCLMTWNGEKSSTFLHGGGFEDPVSGAGATRNSGLLVFLEHSSINSRETPSKEILAGDQELNSFALYIEGHWMSIDLLSFEWAMTLLYPGRFECRDGLSSPSTYEAFLWPDSLKEAVVQILVNEDDFIFKQLSQELQDSSSTLNVTTTKSYMTNRSSAYAVQNIFELHLDIYGRITNPSSKVDFPTRIAQQDRLGRWAGLAHQALNSRLQDVSIGTVHDHLSLRFLWAFTVLSNLGNTCSRDLVIDYFQELRSLLQEAGNASIDLQNNAIMPEISVEAADREISRLTTMDFFISIFDPEKNDPVALIESLEPILETSMQRYGAEMQETALQSDGNNDHADSRDGSDEGGTGDTFVDAIEPQTQQMLQFLNKANLSMTLLLWRRLVDAYSDIQYSPKILSCNLRCIELIVSYFRSPQYSDCNEETRHNQLLRWLRSLDDLLTRTLALALSDAKSLDCMDEIHLQAAISALASLQSLLHVFVLWEDYIRVGQLASPRQINHSAGTAHSNAILKLRDMVVKAWTLQYVLLREIVSQKLTENAITKTDLVVYLKHTHKAIGLRGYCKLSSKVFLRLAKQEILKLDTFEDSETEVAQLILDLYGLKICPTSWEVQDHGCPAETIDRPSAIEIIDRIIIQANRLNVKDLAKSELKLTIDRMQQVIKPPKKSAALSHNRKVLDDYLKTAVNPVDLYRSLRGVGQLTPVKVRNDSTIIAEKGWFFLLGLTALMKHRSQKRSSAGATDDLTVASTYLSHDLELGFEKWETWYRLAQVFDAKIEEATTWTAENMNGKMDDLKSLQRNSIHCYAMAVAVAERCADPTFDTVNKISSLYADFGMRIYGSSREPFSMEAFSLESFKKHYSGETKGMYEDLPFSEMRLYSAWKYASALLRRALVHKPGNWM